jgi:hypothetical protein
MARVPHLFGRDPFARTTIKRFLVSLFDRRPCHWCGSRLGRFRYANEGDARSVSDPGGPGFCSVECWRAYAF